ncbi:MAG: hypothetical protein EOO09_21540 [Chitinophagaceae bacterium]|nr:MAG: hypothetical protein EOO09_21540 [Chitinophagaceae bacterium]
MQEVIRKLKFRGPAVVVNAPAELAASFQKEGLQSGLPNKGTSANTLVFVNNAKEFTQFLGKQLKLVEPDSVLWFAYPKGTSKIKSDINRDILRVTGEQSGITTVAAISIDATWSALRFRPIEKVGS